MFVSCVVVTFNNEDTIENLIESLFKYIDDFIDEIIIIDNSTNMNTFRVVNNLNKSKIRIIKSDGNIGYRRALNYGIKSSKNEIVLVINPDAMLMDNTISDCFLELTKEKVAYCYPDTSDVLNQGVHAGGLSCVPFLISLPVIVDSKENRDLFISVEIGGGAAFAIRRSAYFETGGLDENIFMYDEEEEISLKLRKLGYKIMLYPGSSIYHEGGHSFKSIENKVPLVYNWLSAKPYLYLKHTKDSVLKKIIWIFFFIFVVIEYSLFYKSTAFLDIPIKNIPQMFKTKSSTLTKTKWKLGTTFLAFLLTIKRLKNRYGALHYK